GPGKPRLDKLEVGLPELLATHILECCLDMHFPGLLDNFDMNGHLPTSDEMAEVDELVPTLATIALARD
nr:hypothetical protein [Tanacetum cinerariifolium]